MGVDTIRNVGGGGLMTIARKAREFFFCAVIKNVIKMYF
jgi:hypothetical protein